MLYMYNEILFWLKKDENSTKCATIDDPGGHYAKCDKLVTEK